MNKKMKRPLCLALTVCLVLSLLAGSAYAVNRYFEDAKGHWAEEAIQILTEKGVISGYPDGLAHPDEIITRGEFAALVARTMELPEPEESEVTFASPTLPDIGRSRMLRRSLLRESSKRTISARSFYRISPSPAWR